MLSINANTDLIILVIRIILFNPTLIQTFFPQLFGEELLYFAILKQEQVWHQ